jgi:hypothetical protein
MAISTASGPWRSLTGFITPITYVFATDIVGGEYQILDAGAEILVLSPADGGPASAVDFILPNVETNDGNTWLGPQSAKAELNGIKGSITNYGAVAHVLKGTGTQPVSGNPAAGIPLLPGAVEILRFSAESYFSGLAASAQTLYITPGQGI